MSGKKLNKKTNQSLNDLIKEWEKRSGKEILENALKCHREIMKAIGSSELPPVIVYGILEEVKLTITKAIDVFRLSSLIEELRKKKGGDEIGE